MEGLKDGNSVHVRRGFGSRIAGLHRDFGTGGDAMIGAALDWIGACPPWAMLAGCLIVAEVVFGGRV